MSQNNTQPQSQHTRTDTDTDNTTDTQPCTSDYVLEARIKQAAKQSPDIIGCTNFDIAQAAAFIRSEWREYKTTRDPTKPVAPVKESIVLDGLSQPESVDLTLLVLTDPGLVDDVIYIVNKEIEDNHSVN